MTSITNFHLIPELDKIVESYYYIDDWALDFSKRYIKEYFGEDILEYININKIVKKAIPNIETFIDTIKDRISIEDLPWNINTDLDVLDKYGDSWYNIHDILDYNLYTLYPLIQHIKVPREGNKYDRINDKYIEELISSFYKDI